MSALLYLAKGAVVAAAFVSLLFVAGGWVAVANTESRSASPPSAMLAAVAVTIASGALIGFAWWTVMQ